jgi:hypothetical protein
MFPLLLSWPAPENPSKPVVRDHGKKKPTTTLGPTLQNHNVGTPPEIRRIGTILIQDGS